MQREAMAVDDGIRMRLAMDVVGMITERERKTEPQLRWQRNGRHCTVDLEINCACLARD
jgi:hypothetical protein